jgi:hypothetical protein
MNAVRKVNFSFIGIIIFLYALLTAGCLNNCYFWDTVQQISKEAHWFYQTNFRYLIIPSQNSLTDIVATGYHPPLMGMLTAALWKIFGVHLWVSHLLALIFFFVLLYQTLKLVEKFFPAHQAGWVMLVVFLEASLLAQFSIASPDFILLAAFIASLRGLLERNTWLSSIALIFLFGSNMRGIFAGIALLMSFQFYLYLNSGKKFSFKMLAASVRPFLPAIILSLLYFIFYFRMNGWFSAVSEEGGHYSLPENISMVAKHFIEFLLRSVENGRIIVWAFSLFAFYLVAKKKVSISNEFKMLICCFLILFSIYFLFVFITRMPFSGRYFMPHFFLLTLITLSALSSRLTEKRWKATVLIFLLFELTGHLWIYPEKMAKSWDCTLAHFPYYELRKQCFDYIDRQNMDYEKISAGFCLYGDRGFTELNHAGKKVNTQLDNQYFIYSNISNLPDEWIDELHNPARWKPLRSFEKWPVNITVFENISFKQAEK